jgi:hypothetical protein
VRPRWQRWLAKQSESTHRVETATSLRLVLRPVSGRHAIFGGGFIILGLPILLVLGVVGLPRGGFDRIAAPVLGGLCLLIGIAVIAFGIVGSRKRTIVDRGQKTIEVSGGRPLAFGDVRSLVLRSRTGLTVTPATGHDRHGRVAAYEIVLVTASGKEHRVFGSVNRGRVSPVLHRLSRWVSLSPSRQ